MQRESLRGAGAMGGLCEKGQEAEQAEEAEEAGRSTCGVGVMTGRAGEGEGEAASSRSRRQSAQGYKAARRRGHSEGGTFFRC